MPDGRQKPSFWETVPGIITAVATLIGAVAALITALYSAKMIGHDDPGKAAAGTARQIVVPRPDDPAVPEQGDTITDSITGMEFVYIPEGCFQMGSPPDEKDRGDDEGPVHEVCVDGFWMGKYEVTQGQWQRIMGDNPTISKKGDNYPVARVSWEDAQKFIVEMNRKSGRNYRLPTEAEWEYACRAGNSAKRYDELDKVAWYIWNSGGSIHPVGEKQPNTFGLYDMLGNVWEWCADWYGKDYYASGFKENPTGPLSGSDRVIRGGGWFYNYEDMRSANRKGITPVNRINGLGFRLALPVQQSR